MANTMGRVRAANPVVDTMIKALRLGLEFLFKKSLAQTPVVNANQAVATMRVGTREATLLDRLGHQTSIGGIEAVARIPKDFSRDLQANGLTDALDAPNQMPAARRLGFVLEALCLPRLATVVGKWLAARRRLVHPLEAAPVRAATTTLTSDRWSIAYTAQQKATLKEMA